MNRSKNFLCVLWFRETLFSLVCKVRYLKGERVAMPTHPIFWLSLPLLALVGCTPVSTPTPHRTEKIRIALAGDSTVTEESGWGAGFKKCLTGEVECLNFSRGGRSSKSFTDEGHWAKCIESKPNYILIQFGHNDQPGKGPTRETDPNTTYRENMSRYVDEARNIGAQPILVTSLSRRRWQLDGRISTPNQQPYIDVVRKIAAEKKVPLIDLYALSIAKYEELGKEKCFEISPKDSKGGWDGTHLNPKGSGIFGQMMAEELKKTVPDLAPVIQAPK